MQSAEDYCEQKPEEGNAWSKSRNRDQFGKPVAEDNGSGATIAPPERMTAGGNGTCRKGKLCPALIEWRGEQIAGITFQFISDGVGPYRAIKDRDPRHRRNNKLSPPNALVVVVILER